jgi:hypothetical protein
LNQVPGIGTPIAGEVLLLVGLQLAEGEVSDRP